MNKLMHPKSNMIFLSLYGANSCGLYFLFSGIPDFSEVYGFIGSVFDPESKDHVQKLKEMDPINFETVSSS